jgi:hypothetical protein
MAYIPRGVLHDARSSEELSLHITVGVLSYRWADLLLEFVAEASLKDSSFRKSLPPGFAREDFNRGEAQEIFRNLLERLAVNSDCGALLNYFADKWISASPPLLNGQMDQLASLDQLRIESFVGARSSTAFRVERDTDSTSLYAFGRKIIFPVHVDDALRFALRQPRVAIGDLPGNLDDNGKLVLVRRLVREGLMVVLAV